MQADASSQDYSSCIEISFAPGTGGVSHASSIPPNTDVLVVPLCLYNI